MREELIGFAASLFIGLSIYLAMGSAIFASILLLIMSTIFFFIERKLKKIN